MQVRYVDYLWSRKLFDGIVNCHTGRDVQQPVQVLAGEIVRNGMSMAQATHNIGRSSSSLAQVNVQYPFPATKNRLQTARSAKQVNLPKTEGPASDDI